MYIQINENYRIKVMTSGETPDGYKSVLFVPEVNGDRGWQTTGTHYVMPGSYKDISPVDILVECARCEPRFFTTVLVDVCDINLEKLQ